MNNIVFTSTGLHSISKVYLKAECLLTRTNSDVNPTKPQPRALSDKTPDVRDTEGLTLGNSRFYGTELIRNNLAEEKPGRAPLCSQYWES